MSDAPAPNTHGVVMLYSFEPSPGSNVAVAVDPAEPSTAVAGEESGVPNVSLMLNAVGVFTVIPNLKRSGIRYMSPNFAFQPAISSWM